MFKLHLLKAKTHTHTPQLGCLIYLFIFLPKLGCLIKGCISASIKFKFYQWFVLYAWHWRYELFPLPASFYFYFPEIFQHMFNFACNNSRYVLYSQNNKTLRFVQATTANINRT